MPAHGTLLLLTVTRPETPNELDMPHGRVTAGWQALDDFPRLPRSPLGNPPSRHNEWLQRVAAVYFGSRQGVGASWQSRRTCFSNRARLQRGRLIQGKRLRRGRKPPEAYSGRREALHMRPPKSDEARSSVPSGPRQRPLIDVTNPAGALSLLVPVNTTKEDMLGSRGVAPR